MDSRAEKADVAVIICGGSGICGFYTVFDW